MARSSGAASTVLTFGCEGNRLELKVLRRKQRRDRGCVLPLANIVINGYAVPCLGLPILLVNSTARLETDLRRRV